MPIVLIIALVLFAGVASFWLTVPLLLLCGADLSHLLPPLPCPYMVRPFWPGFLSPTEQQ